MDRGDQYGAYDVKVCRRGRQVVTRSLHAGLSRQVGHVLSLPSLTLESTTMEEQIRGSHVVVVSSTSLALCRLRTIVRGPTSQHAKGSKDDDVLFYPIRRALKDIRIDGKDTNYDYDRDDTTNVNGGVRRLSQTSHVTSLFARPIPIRDLLQRGSYVLRTRELRVGDGILMVRLPLVERVGRLPLATTATTSIVVSIRVLPTAIFTKDVPSCLQIQAGRGVVPPTLRLFSF